MNARRKQRFVGIDVAHSADESLIEQERFDSDAAVLHPLEKIIETHRERVGADSFQCWRNGRIKLDSAELADVVIDERTTIQLQIGARVFPWLCIPQQLARHAEMHVQNAAVKGDQNLLAVAANSFDGGAGQGRCGLLETTASDTPRAQFRGLDSAPNNVRCDGANDSFYFRQFGQAYL